MASLSEKIGPQRTGHDGPGNNRKRSPPMTNHISPTLDIAHDKTPGETVSYGFLDTETSGTTRHDCILSFALVMTDADFNPVQQISIPVARPPHIVPHSKALLVNRVGLDMLDRGMRPREAFAYLAESLDAYARCGVTFIAHNMNFDLRFVREGLFANLCDPYPMSRRGAGIADTLAMARAIATVDPGALAVPLIDGKPSFKLGPLLRANGINFDDDNAHDALTDAYGVCHLARLLRSRSPDLFDHLIAMSRRDNVLGFLEENVVLRHFTHFGAPRFPVSRLVTLGAEDRNAAVLIDLTVDPAPILAMKADELAAAMCALPRVLSVIRLNAMPALLPAGVIKVEAEPDDYTIAARSTAVAFAPHFKQRVEDALRIRAASFPSSLRVEEQLFDGFPSNRDRRMCLAFHAAPTAAARASIARLFDDARLREHARRLIHAETPELLSSSEHAEMDEWLAYRLLTHDEVPWLTLHKAVAELAALRPALAGEDGTARLATPEERKLIERIEAIEAYYLGLAAGHQDRG